MKIVNIFQKRHFLPKFALKNFLLIFCFISANLPKFLLSPKPFFARLLSFNTIKGAKICPFFLVYIFLFIYTCTRTRAIFIYYSRLILREFSAINRRLT